MPPAMTRGQIARETGVGIETVRFYEQKGLLEEPRRTANGYRCYDSDALRRIRFILRAKSLGFSLPEIRELFELQAESAAKCLEVHTRTQAKLDEINRKIRLLEGIRHSLEEMLSRCNDLDLPIQDCAILDAFDPDGNATADAQEGE